MSSLFCRRHRTWARPWGEPTTPQCLSHIWHCLTSTSRRNCVLNIRLLRLEITVGQHIAIPEPCIQATQSGWPHGLLSMESPRSPVSPPRSMLRPIPDRASTPRNPCTQATVGNAATYVQMAISAAKESAQPVRASASVTDPSSVTKVHRSAALRIPIASAVRRSRAASAVARHHAQKFPAPIASNA